MQRYLLSIYQPEGQLTPESLEAIMRELEALNRAMKEAGVWVFGAGLKPPGTATVLRNYAGEVTTTDGPYAESKEQIGGFTVIQTPDPDTALEWAARLAQVVTLPIEVRPMVD